MRRPCRAVVVWTALSLSLFVLVPASQHEGVRHIGTRKRTVRSSQKTSNELPQTASSRHSNFPRDSSRICIRELSTSATHRNERTLHSPAQMVLMNRLLWVVLCLSALCGSNVRLPNWDVG